MKILVTGAKGFVGKNIISTLNTNKEYEVYSYDLGDTQEQLKQYTKDCDFVVHLAGVNRPTRSEEFYEGNVGCIEYLCSCLEANKNTCPVLVSSSTQVGKDNDYAKSKKEGEEYLLSFGTKNGNKIYIYRFANLFGKWCRPNYNSVTATWCNNVANHLDIQVNDRSAVISLCYIDDVVEEIMNCIKGKANYNGEHYCVEPLYDVSLGELESLIKSFKDTRKNLEIVKQDAFTRKLYATYLSYLPTNGFSYPLKMNVDERGSFTEFLKTKEYGQVSVNISKPNITKGNHWHHTKNEKFLVVSGNGLIKFRNIFSKEIIEYHVSGDKLEVIDIPTGYTHNIINEGKNDMVTIMWANERFDPNKPDTFFEEV